MLEIKIANAKADCKLLFVSSIEGLKDEALLGQMDFKDLFFAQGSKILYAKIPQDGVLLGELAAKAMRALKKLPFETVSLCFDPKLSFLELRMLLVGLLSGDYVFDLYKSKKEECKLKTLWIESHLEGLEELLSECQILSQSINLTRDLVNTIPNDATPLYLAQVAREEAESAGLECKILDGDALRREKMHAMLSVARASIHEPRLIHLSYKPKGIPQARIVFVGKGLTYDSGGLSLKPADYMVTMKADKSGGCAVLGILSAVARLELPLEVHGIVGAVENMIGGDAYKPDDVLISREGKSIEVRNTDAEGRLVLADCLSYAQDLEPDFLIDLATLTGACVVALGEYTYGIMGHNASLKANFENAALQSGELVAQLPFNPHLKKLIDSKIADVCNVSSSRYGGAITAGLFLSEFIRDAYKDRWLHLDIAGPAYVEKEWGIHPYGASGIGVQGCIAFLKSLSKEQ